MIISFSGLSRKFIVRNKIRVLFAIFGVTLVICLITSINSLFNNIESSFRNEVKETFGDAEVMVGYNVGTGQYLSAATADSIQKMSEIDTTSKLLINPWFNTKDSYSQVNSQISIYAIGTDSNYLAKGRYKFSKNVGADEVIISDNLSKQLHVNVGSNVIIPLPNMKERIWKVVEIIPDAKGAISSAVAIFNISSFQNDYNLGNNITMMLLKLKPDSNKQYVINKIMNLDKNLRIDVIDNSEYVQKNLQSIKAIGYCLEVLTIFISILFILSNFRILIYECKKELATIRTIGGIKIQCFKLIFSQGILVVCIGNILGLILAFLSSSFFSSLFSKMFGLTKLHTSFDWKQSISISMFVSIIIMLFILIPAIKSTNILPIQAIREVNNNKLIESKFQKLMGLIFLAIGLILFLIPVFVNYSSGFKSLISISAGFSIIIGVFSLFSYFMKPLLNSLLPVFQFVGGRESFVAIKNIIPDTRKNAIVIFALSAALTISIPATGIMESVKVNSLRDTYKEYVSDLVISSSYGFKTNLKYNFKNYIEQISGITSAIPISRPQIASIDFGKTSNNEKQTSKIMYNISDISLLSNLGYLPVIKGDPSNYIILTSEYANDLRLKVGDNIRIYKDKNQENYTILKVALIVDSIPGITSQRRAIVDWGNKYMQFDNTTLEKILVNIDKTRYKEVENGLNDLKAQFPEIKWSTLNQAISEVNQLVQQRYALLNIVLAIIVVIGILGIISTISSHIESQRHEYAILRAICLTPYQLTKVILSQCLLYSIIGIVIGTITGEIMAISLAIGLEGKIVFNRTLYMYIVIAIIGLNFILTLPIARKISRRSVVAELTHSTR
jgi:ABC-type lipoprotein release transport system permease subunit